MSDQTAAWLELAAEAETEVPDLPRCRACGSECKTSHCGDEAPLWWCPNCRRISRDGAGPSDTTAKLAAALRAAVAECERLRAKLAEWGDDR